MRIRSTFQDYYDGVQAYGVDTTRTYVRVPKLVPVSEVSCHGPDLNVVEDCSLSWGPEDTLCGLPYHTKISARFLGFCGRYYPLLECEQIQHRRVRDGHRIAHQTEVVATAYLHTLDALDEYIAAAELDYSPRNRKRWRWSYETSVAQLRKAFAYLLDYCDRYEHHDTFQDLGAPVYIVESVARAAQADYCKRPVQVPETLTYGELVYLLNPHLKTLDLPTVVDPYTCYQTIAQYLSGVLGNVESRGAELTDAQQVQRHGFDARCGFRKRPRR